MTTLKNGSETIYKSKIFILINCIDGKIDSVFEKICKIDSVSKIQKTDGAYDLLVILEADTDKLKILMQKIRTIEDVKYTLTLRSNTEERYLADQ